MAAPKGPDFSKNLLFYGDNLEVLRTWIADESVDLIYLDPPFNSNRTYNVLFKHKTGKEANAQIQAFDDTWTWSQDDEVVFAELLAAGGKVADAVTAFRQLLGPSDMLSYLVMMTIRLVELRRVLKPTGSIYLHCDPVASHYLKIILDVIFGPENFRNDIVWKRADAKGDASGQGARHYGRVNDHLLFYGRSDAATLNPQFAPMDRAYVDRWYRHTDPDGRRYKLDNLTGPGGAAKGNPYYEVMGVSRHWRYSKERMQELIDAGLVVQTKPGNVPMFKRYLDTSKGVPITSNWADISFIRGHSAEKLGYPTQKPLALLQRIVEASSNPGDVVLDPFCGCGTAVDAAQRLGRRWVGIDVSYLSVDLIETRMLDAHPGIAGSFEIVGVPRDPEGALALFQRSPFDFERWAVSLVDGTPNEKQVGDRGVDGIVRFPVSASNDVGKIVVSVKGGNLNPSMVRDLAGTIEAQRAAMGLLITNQPPTRGMVEAAQHSGSYEHPLTGARYPKVQIVTVGELIAGRRPAMPTPFMPYLPAPKFAPDNQLQLGV